MLFDAAHSQQEALDILKNSDFGEGLAEFVRLLSEQRHKHLTWPKEVNFVTWVYDNVNLIKQESSRAGPMKLSVYQREIGNNIFHNPECRQVSVLKGVQIGYSKLLRVIYAYAIACLAKRVAVAFPVQDDMGRFLDDEIKTLYERVDAMKELLREVKRGEANDNANVHRYSNGALAYFRAAYNEADLQGFTSWLQIGDELDRPGWLPRGNSAGDKVNQWRNRGVDFEDSKLVVGSTPGVRDISVIWKEWQTSDKRKLFVKCPHCQTDQELRWGSDKTRYGFRWSTDKNGHVEEAWYQCDSDRKCKIDEDNDKEQMIEAGVYRPTAVPTLPGNVGVHAPSWISMSPGARWKVLAQKWINAQGDIEKLKEFVTFNMAEPWDEAGEGLDERAVSNLFQAYPEEIPDDVVLLTCGGDTQKNKAGKGTMHEIPSREFTVTGWTRHGQMRVIGHWVFLGKPGDSSSDEEVRQFLRRQWKRRDGRPMGIMATAMDSNGGFADEVRAFAASFSINSNVWAIIGDNKTKGTRSRYVWPTKATTPSAPRRRAGRQGRRSRTAHRRRRSPRRSDHACIRSRHWSRRYHARIRPATSRRHRLCDQLPRAERSRQRLRVGNAAAEDLCGRKHMVRAARRRSRVIGSGWHHRYAADKVEDRVHAAAGRGSPDAPHVGVVCRARTAEAAQFAAGHGRLTMSQKTMTMLSGYVQKRIRSEVDGRPRTLTVDVMARWDVDNESGLVIGSEGTIDASSCQIGTNVVFVAPT